jgi:hypothetical protein
MINKFVQFLDESGQDVFLRIDSLEYFLITEKLGVETLEEENYHVIFCLKNDQKFYSETTSYRSCLSLTDWIQDNENPSEN